MPVRVSELVGIKKLWKFNTIGHIDSEGSAPRWMETVGVKDLVTTRHDIKWSLPVGSDGADVVFYLITDDANDGNKDDYVVSSEVIKNNCF